MKTYEEAVSFIEQVYKYGSHPGSENAAHLLALLGHPEDSLKIIHVAGTNGKGSVCAFLADMLTACGRRTGLFISPHLVDIRERIQIDRSMISKEDFLLAFNEVEEAVQKLAGDGYTGITYFDYLFAAAVCYFARQNTEYVVMETGLGGLYDSTNAVRHPVLTIITSISLDHTEVLGNTLAKIALQKAGILKTGVPLIYCGNEPEVCEILTAEAVKKQVPYLKISRKNCTLLSMTEGALSFEFCIQDSMSTVLTVNSSALYQMENGAIAYSAALLLQLLDIPQLSDMPIAGGTLPRSVELTLAPDMLSAEQTETLKQALAHSCWEGRMEQVAPEVYVDGAHNADGIRMLLSSLWALLSSRMQASAEAPLTSLTPASPQTSNQPRRAILLFTAVKEKDTDKMIQEICESGLFNRFILTTLDSPRAIPAETLKTQFEQYTNVPITVCSSPEEAFACGRAVRQEGEIFLSAGSLYLVGTIKELLMK